MQLSYIYYLLIDLGSQILHLKTPSHKLSNFPFMVLALTTKGLAICHSRLLYPGHPHIPALQFSQHPLCSAQVLSCVLVIVTSGLDYVAAVFAQ